MYTVGGSCCTSLSPWLAHAHICRRRVRWCRVGPVPIQKMETVILSCCLSVALHLEGAQLLFYGLSQETFSWVVSGSLCIAHFHITLFGSSRAGVLRQGCERDCLHKAEGAHAQAGSRGHVNRRPFCLLACGAKSHYFGVHRVSMWSGGERPSL